MNVSQVLICSTQGGDLSTSNLLSIPFKRLLMLKLVELTVNPSMRHLRKRLPCMSSSIFHSYNEVRNLELVLPLISTPTPDSASSAVAGHSRPCLSALRPRGMLPMEMDTPQSSGSPSRFQKAMRNRAQQVHKVLSRTKKSSDSD